MASVKPSEISDWLYVDNEKLVGGYTVRVHYNDLSLQQKQEFDRRRISGSKSHDASDAERPSGANEG